MPPSGLKLTKDELKYFKGEDESNTKTDNKDSNTTTATSGAGHGAPAIAVSTPTAAVVIPEAIHAKVYSNAHTSYTKKHDKPIFLSINRKILDVSYGGTEMYGPAGGYHIFAGIDCSKALAKMKFDQELWNDSDLSELSEDERKVLEDWDKKLCSKYPLVGTLID